MPLAAPVTRTTRPACQTPCVGPFRHNFLACRPKPSHSKPAGSRAERERRVLDAAAELFYARGVHEVGMDELIAATGLGKATVYRLFPTKDALIGAYLRRLADQILARSTSRFGTATTRLPPSGRSSPPSARTWPARLPRLRVQQRQHRVRRPRPSGRVAARDYRAELHRRLSDLAAGARPDLGPRLGAQPRCSSTGCTPAPPTSAPTDRPPRA